MTCKIGAGRCLVLQKSSSKARRPVVPMNAVKEVFMPALSSTMTEGKIVSWLKSPGDKVARGEALVVVESGAMKCHQDQLAS
jgi:pyruvate dehydrogenase E2 component (dihydrolipoamide acetyltransferase)